MWDDDENVSMFGYSGDINDVEREGFAPDETTRQQEKLVDANFFNQFADDFDEDDMALGPRA